MLEHQFLMLTTNWICIITEFWQRHKRVICEVKRKPLREDEKTSPHSHDLVHCFGVFDSRLLFGCARLFS